MLLPDFRKVLEGSFHPSHQPKISTPVFQLLIDCYQFRTLLPIQNISTSAFRYPSLCYESAFSNRERHFPSTNAIDWTPFPSISHRFQFLIQIFFSLLSVSLHLIESKSIAFHDVHPIDKVHFLITPKKHIENLMACNESDKDIISNMLLLAPKLAKDLGLKGFRTMINSGVEGGQEVFHMHFHVYGGSSKLAKI